MQIEVFKNFDLIDIITSFVSFEHTRRFLECGEFTLKLSTFEHTNSLEIDNIIMVDNVPYIIENIHQYKNVEQVTEIEITGRSLQCILSRRIVIEFTISPSITYEVQMYKLIEQNFISPSDSKRRVSFIKNERLKNINLKPDDEYIFENSDLLDIVNEICNIAKVGYDIKYLPEQKKMVFEVLASRDMTKSIVFSEQFTNITDLEIYTQSKEYKNICYLNNGGIISQRGEHTGFDRRELIVTGDKIGEMVKELEHQKMLISTECIILQNDYFKYKTDWDLGDTVLIEDSEFGVNLEKSIIEIRESYTDTHEIEIIFGDKILNIYEKLAKKG